LRKRTKAREIALQILYEYDATGEMKQERVDSFVAGTTTSDETAGYARALVAGVIENRDEFDGIFEKLSDHWAVSRMPMVDRNVLRIGAYELLHGEGVPPKVAINESVELAKKFGSADSGRFVNAILDRINRDQAAAAGGDAE
jgi:N utilization substance protein B